MPQEVGLFADHDNDQVKEIAEAVSELGAVPRVFDIQLGGERANTLAISAPDTFWNDTDFRDIRALHIRCIAPRTLPSLPPVLNARFHAEYRAEFLKEQEFQAATYSFFEIQAELGKLVVNRLTGAYVDHNSKAQFNEKLAAAGFPVPRSLSTNCPARAARFIEQVGEAVVKPAIGVGSTRVVTEHDLERLDELPACPALFQERVVGEVVRVHIVADTVVLAIRVDTAGEIDSRTSPRGFEYVKLPDQDEARLVKANRFLGLHYAAWDVIVTDAKKIVYLDCNPGPYLMWIGPEFRQAVFLQLAKYLVAFARSGRLEEASERVERWRPS